MPELVILLIITENVGGVIVHTNLAILIITDNVGGVIVHTKLVILLIITENVGGVIVHTKCLQKCFQTFRIFSNFLPSESSIEIWRLTI